MFLPSRLRDTTLGDLLATLHRGYATGVLELVEPQRRHTIHLRRGLVHAVECSERAWRLGDLLTAAGLCARDVVERASREARARDQRSGHRLVAERAVSHAQRDEALGAQRARRLESLYGVADAELRFHPARPLPPGVVEQHPMSARETFFERARRRDRGRGGAKGARGEALAVLGLGAEATLAEVRARYRERVRALHPDLAPVEGEAQQGRRVAELKAVLDAYRALCG